MKLIPNEISIIRVLSIVFCSGIVSVFAYLLLNYAIYDPACCADDAFISQIAMNVRHGVGYASGMNYGQTALYEIKPWDPGISTGPPIVLLSAFAYWITGDWVPAAAVSTVLLNLALLAYIAVLLRQSLVRTLMFSAIFSVLILSVFSWNRPIIGGSLGEFPASLMIVIGAILFARAIKPEGDEKRTLPAILAGIFFALALLTKTIALIPIAVTAMVIVLQAFPLKATWRSPTTFWSTPEVPQLLRICLLGGIAAAAVLASVEFWKLLSLGPKGYMDNWQAVFDFMDTVSERAGSTEGQKMFEQLREWRQVDTRFMEWSGVPATLATAALLWSGIGSVWKKQSDPLLNAVLALFVASAVVLIWWLQQGPKVNVRYTFLAVIIAFSGIAILASRISFEQTKRPVRSVLAVSAAMTFLLAWNYDEVRSLKNYFGPAALKPTARYTELLNARDILRSEPYVQMRPIITTHWAAAADLQLALTTPSDFAPYRAKNLDKSGSHLVAIRRQFANAVPQFPSEVMTGCNVLLDGQHYWIAICQFTDDTNG